MNRTLALTSLKIINEWVDLVPMRPSIRLIYIQIHHRCWSFVVSGVDLLFLVFICCFGTTLLQDKVYLKN